MASKNAKTKEKLNQICSLLVFLAVVLIGVSQLLIEEGFENEKGEETSQSDKSSGFWTTCYSDKSCCESSTAPKNCLSRDFCIAHSCAVKGGYYDGHYQGVYQNCSSTDGCSTGDGPNDKGGCPPGPAPAPPYGHQHDLYRGHCTSGQLPDKNMPTCWSPGTTTLAPSSDPCCAALLGNKSRPPNGDVHCDCVPPAAPLSCPEPMCDADQWQCKNSDGVDVSKSDCWGIIQQSGYRCSNFHAYSDPEFPPWYECKPMDQILAIMVTMVIHIMIVPSNALQNSQAEPAVIQKRAQNTRDHPTVNQI